MKKIQTLNGAWKMRACDCDLWHDAQVPGSVYADLLRDQSIPDPFWRENERDAFELLRKDWEYTRGFEPDPALLEMDRVILCCEGLDTLADITVNNQPVGHADNMHITWEWDIRSLLHTGNNTITVRFSSPIEFALAEGEKSPAWCSTDAIPGYPHLRKAHCMFGWDWGPRLPDAGIWRDISIIGLDKARLETADVFQSHCGGAVELTIVPDIDGAADGCAWSVTITDPDGHSFTTNAEAGADCLEIPVPDPQLWWPHGYGAQPLYTVAIDLFDAQGKALDRWERRIGLRTLSVSREKDAWGEEFCHIVNGVKIFAMGADYIPEDNILSRVTPERTRRLLEDAVLANYNAVRVWGGGYYPDDFFYDICDELGLLVWQDLMYACAFYDLTPEFEASIRTETIQNVRRLRHHPSLALICGNNEMEEFMAEAIRTTAHGDLESMGPKRYSHFTDYVKMFEYILPEIVRNEAPQTFWWPASPSSGGSFENPQDPDRGDVHYWQVWHGEKPFTDYRKHFFRYASEFGFQSFPCLATVKSFTLPEDRNVFSRIMERHQRNSAANGKILSYLSQTFLYPSDFDNLLYASQLLQADAIRYGVEHWRRNRGRCMGAIVWQLNDCWPVASWSSIDYFGRWKALHYMEKRFFAPVMISCNEEGELSQNPKINEWHPAPIEKSARFNVANETLKEVRGTVHWALRGADAGILREGCQELTVPALTSVWMDKIEFPDAPVTASYVSYDFTVDGEIVSRGTAIFCAPKHFEFRDPALKVRLEGNEAVVTASAYAREVFIESEDPDLLLEDNFFDLNADTRRVRVLRGCPDGLRVRSVYNIQCH